MEHPHEVDFLKDVVRGLVEIHLPSPLPAVSITLSSQLEFRDFTVNDARACLFPAEGRLGRRMTDTVPSALMEGFNRQLHVARKTKRPAINRYLANGQQWNARIIVPKPDIVAVSITEAPRY